MKRATRTPLGSKLYAGHPRKTTLRRALVCIASHWGVGDAFPRRVVFQESLFLKNFRLPSAAYKGRPRKTTLGPRAAADATPPKVCSGLRQRPFADLGETHARADGFGIQLDLDQRRLAGLGRR